MMLAWSCMPCCHAFKNAKPSNAQKTILISSLKIYLSIINTLNLILWLCAFRMWNFGAWQVGIAEQYLYSTSCNMTRGSWVWRLAGQATGRKCHLSLRGHAANILEESSTYKRAHSSDRIYIYIRIYCIYVWIDYMHFLTAIFLEKKSSTLPNFSDKFFIAKRNTLVILFTYSLYTLYTSISISSIAGTVHCIPKAFAKATLFMDLVTLSLSDTSCCSSYMCWQISMFL